MTLQPLLHDLVATVHGTTSALSGGDGQIRASGVQGVFHADSRVLSEALLGSTTGSRRRSGTPRRARAPPASCRWPAGWATRSPTRRYGWNEPAGSGPA